MLEAFKGRWQSVQQDVSSGFQKLKQRKSPSLQGLLQVSTSSLYDVPSTSSGGVGISPGAIAQSVVNQEAGSEILHRNQQIWQETRRYSEQNVLAADAASAALAGLQAKCRSAASGMLCLKRELGTLDRVAEDLSNLVTETAKLQGLCEEVESSLAYLDVICDTQGYQEQRLDANFNFSLYRERKVAEFSETKAKMAIEYMDKMEERERRKSQEQTEKQKLYQQAFETDLELYKSTGLIANTLPPLEIDRKSPLAQSKSLPVENDSLNESGSGDANAGRASPTALLRQLINLSHATNRIDPDSYKAFKLSRPGSGFSANEAAMKELVSLLAASQLHGFPAATEMTSRAVKKRREDLGGGSSSKLGEGMDSSSHGSDFGDVIPKERLEIASAEENESFSAGDAALLEEFLSDVKLEDSGIAGSESQSVNNDDSDHS